MLNNSVNNPLANNGDSETSKSCDREANSSENSDIIVTGFGYFYLHVLIKLHLFILLTRFILLICFY